VERRQLPFKDLQPDNLLELDPATYGLGPFLGALPTSAEELSIVFLGIAVSNEVPLQIEGLLRVALATASYGMFFSPLYDVADGLLLRAGDAAVALKAAEVGAPKSVTSFKKRVDWLQSVMAITAVEHAFWDDVRKMRNQSTHLVFPLPYTDPGLVHYQAVSIVHAINALFDKDVDFSTLQDMLRPPTSG
jgi:hypothetical protein